eukprot:CAMPEP_0203759068 /NCGR_PEP_ID=MMETSP0098-20131031/11983_1 /ASSEMBLY_ACC=CAM_ASM_000208 /TAXON_ID=96639 /ORGANISM=" , Strain NY0313808BC1" /LENGTH=632 /DNA_ID=CAMNT_0050651803 /DNA_START=3372 /DNA_END=5267 /DNA_ORIENTATION=+
MSVMWRRGLGQSIQSGLKRAGEARFRGFHRSATLASDTVGVEYVGKDEAGYKLLENPVYNKGCAFSNDERDELGLNGLLPAHVETVEQQMTRVRLAYNMKPTDMERHIYLRQLQEQNEVLFYKFMQENVVEVLPILYTPTVGDACIHFSKIYRRPRGIYINYPDRHKMRDAFENLVNNGWTGGPVDVDTELDVRVIVVTDGSRILGLGDLGAGGMGIPIGKCSLYTAIGGIESVNCLPMLLDVGTDNEEMRNDPSYIGWRHKRIKGEEYFEFVDQFVQLVKEYFPKALVQWEDFNIDAAGPLLHKYRDSICSFNDDIQGTACVSVGTLLAACKQAKVDLTDQRVVMVGSGSAGCGIASFIKAAMVDQGLSEEEARSRFYMIDKDGLLTDDMDNLRDFQQPLAQKKSDLKDWPELKEGEVSYSLVDTLKHAKAGVLIGVSGVPNLFTEEAIRTMTETLDGVRPIVFPLSNPTARAEATPEQVLTWSNFTAIVATGTAFEPTKIVIEESDHSQLTEVLRTTQCNNSYIFPGLGLGITTAGAKRVTDGMLMASAKALADQSPVNFSDNPKALLLPPLRCVIDITDYVASKVALAAIKDGVATNPNVNEENVLEMVRKQRWTPAYKEVRLIKNKKE